LISKKLKYTTIKRQHGSLWQTKVNHLRDFFAILHQRQYLRSEIIKFIVNKED